MSLRFNQNYKRGETRTSNYGCSCRLVKYTFSVLGMYLLQYNLEVMNSQSGRGLHTETLDTYSHNTYWHSPYHR